MGVILHDGYVSISLKKTNCMVDKTEDVFYDKSIRKGRFL